MVFYAIRLKGTSFWLLKSPSWCTKYKFEDQDVSKIRIFNSKSAASLCISRIDRMGIRSSKEVELCRIKLASASGRWDHDILDILPI